jgi:hypothetical protein
LILDTARIASDAAYRSDMRHRFLTDHFFAARTLGFHDFNERAHRPAVNLYFPKNPNMPMKAQDSIHKRLHLDPRHTFKTTLKRVDRIQWVAAFPEDVTFLIESATQPLAKEIAILSAMAFYTSSGAPETDFQLLFPELLTKKEPEGVWNVPTRKRRGAGDLDSTLAYTSPKSAQSGWHPFVMEPDDVEDTLNSGIGVHPDVRQKVIDVCDQNENLLRDGGFINISGTRYHPFDYYGKCLELAKDNPEVWKVLVRCSIIVKSGARLVPGEFPAPDEIELQFPEFDNLSYAKLREKYMQNYESFMCQQQNDPQGGNIPTFDEKLYASCLIAPERVPIFEGQTYICWRPPYSGKDNMGEAAGAAARVVDGKVYVIDCWQGNYVPSRLAERIVSTQKQHQADALMLIGTPGSEFLGGHIRNEAARRNVSLRVQWLGWEERDELRANTIKHLEPLMKVGRLMFSSAMTKAQECHKQFVHFGLVKEDGIAECVSKFAELVPLSLMRANMQEEELAYQRRRRDDAMVNSFLQQQNMPQVDELAQQKANAHTQAMSKVSHWSLPPMPGGLDG